MDEAKDVKNTDNISDSTGSMEEEAGMDELLNPARELEEGKTAKVMVVGETPDGFLVDLGLKSEGLIPRADFSSGIPADEVAPGKEVMVMIIRLHTEDGHPLVSYRQAREAEAWDKIAAEFKDAQPVEGVIRRKVKGGYIVDIGVDAFLPASQLELRMVKDPAKYIGQSLQFVVTELNRGQKNIVLSRRKILEAAQKELREKTMATLTEGQIVEGSVTGITDFGAFVDIGGIEGLLHIGDIVWYHLKKVEDVLHMGQHVRVKVLKIDREKGKVSLGMKQLNPRPWETAAEKYPVGLTVKGRITSLTDFGIFVEVEPGLEGLLHFSEISWVERSEDFKQQFKPGQELELKVIAVDPQKEKLSLSLKRLQSNPWEQVKLNYPPGVKVKGTVTHLTPFGAFVKLPEGIEGLIHVADMSWTRKVRHPQDVVQVGQEVEAVVLEVNSQAEKIVLSLKHLSEDPFKKYHPGVMVSGVVKRFADFGAFVELEPGVEALLRLSEIGPTKVNHPSEAVALEQTIEAKVIKSDHRERKIDISIRRLDQERERDLLRKYAGHDEKPTLGEVLEEQEH